MFWCPRYKSQSQYCVEVMIKFPFDELRDISFCLGGCKPPRDNLPWEMAFTMVCVTAPIGYAHVWYSFLQELSKPTPSSTGHCHWLALRRAARWRSGESTLLPPMWPGFDSQTRRRMSVGFVGSLLCSERLFPRVLRFSPLLKNLHLKRFDLC